MPTQVLRIETRDRLDAALVSHVRGTSRPDHADGPPPSVLSDRVDAARKTIARLTSTPRRGRPPKHAVDVLFAGPPRREADDAWEQDRVAEWAAASVRWLEGLFPDRIAVAALHVDEASPHVHALLIPETDDGRLSWRSLVQTATGKRRDIYRNLQDRYHAEVAERFGLERGARGSDRKHTPLTREAGVEARLARERKTRERLAEAESALAETEAQVAKQRGLADDAARAAKDAQRERAKAKRLAKEAAKKKREEEAHHAKLAEARKRLGDEYHDLQVRALALQSKTDAIESKRRRAEAEARDEALGIVESAKHEAHRIIESAKHEARRIIAKAKDILADAPGAARWLRERGAGERASERPIESPPSRLDLSGAAKPKTAAADIMEAARQRAPKPRRPRMGVRRGGGQDPSPEEVFGRRDGR